MNDPEQEAGLGIPWTQESKAPPESKSSGLSVVLWLILGVPAAAMVVGFCWAIAARLLGL